MPEVKLDWVGQPSKSGAAVQVKFAGHRRPVWLPLKSVKLDRKAGCVAMPDWMAAEKLAAADEPLEPGSKDWLWERVMLRTETEKRPHRVSASGKAIGISCYLMSAGDVEDQKGQRIQAWLPKAQVRDGHAPRTIIYSAVLRVLGDRHPDVLAAILGGNGADYLVRRLLAKWPLSFDQTEALRGLAPKDAPVSAPASASDWLS